MDKIKQADRSTTRARVAAEVRAHMGRVDISQLQLAAMTGIPQSTLNRRLRPRIERDSFKVGELERIAKALGVSVVDFFRCEPEHPESGGAGAPDSVQGATKPVGLQATFQACPTRLPTVWSNLIAHTADLCDVA